MLTDDEARTLLHAALDDGHIGIHDSSDAARAITELVGLCHGFPLALGLIAARIRARPDLLHDVVGELRDLGLNALDSGDATASLSTVLSWSLRHVTDEQRTVLGLLGIAPGLDTTLPAVLPSPTCPRTMHAGHWRRWRRRLCSTGVRVAGT